MTQLNEKKQLILDTYNHFVNITKPLSELTSLAYLMLLDGLNIDYDIYNGKGDITFSLKLNDYNFHKYTIKEISNFITANLKNAVKYIYSYLTSDNPNDIIVELNYSDTFNEAFIQEEAKKAKEVDNIELTEINYDEKLNVSFTVYNKKIKTRYDVISSFIFALYIFNKNNNKKNKNITIDRLKIELADNNKLKQKFRDRLKWSFKEKLKQEFEDKELRDKLLQELNKASGSKRDSVKKQLQEYSERLKSKVEQEFEDRDINKRIDNIMKKLKIGDLRKYYIDNKCSITIHDISIKKLDKNPFIKRLKQHCITRGWIDNNYNLLEHNVVWLEKKLVELANGKRCAICGDVIISSKKNAVVCNKCKIKGKRKKDMLNKYFDNLTGKWLMSKDDIIVDMKRRSEATGSKDTVKDWNALISSLMETIETEWKHA